MSSVQQRMTSGFACYAEGTGCAMKLVKVEDTYINPDLVEAIETVPQGNHPPGSRVRFSTGVKIDFKTITPDTLAEALAE